MVCNAGYAEIIGICIRFAHFGNAGLPSVGTGCAVFNCILTRIKRSFAAGCAVIGLCRNGSYCKRGIILRVISNT